MKTIKKMLLLPIITAILFGCAITEVPLTPIVVSSSNAPSAKAKTVLVVSFTDARALKAIGITSSGAEIQTKGSVTAWVTQSIAALLQEQGLRVATANTMQEAQSLAPDIIIEGKIEKITLESEAFSTSVAITLQTTTTKKAGQKSIDMLSSKVSGINNPFGNTEAEVLLSALRNACSEYIKTLTEGH